MAIVTENISTGPIVTGFESRDDRHTKTPSSHKNPIATESDPTDRCADIGPNISTAFPISTAPCPKNRCADIGPNTSTAFPISTAFPRRHTAPPATVVEVCVLIVTMVGMYGHGDRPMIYRPLQY